MTIEEKAQAYDMALENAKHYHSEMGDDICRVLEECFPVLKESEDEVMRAMAIKAVHAPEAQSCIKSWGINPDDVIAWLEKQGETFTKKDVNDAYLKGVADTKNEIEKQYEANYQIRKDIATFIFNYRGDIKDRAKWMDYLGIKISFVEKQGEQKPADKIEPKFNVGDWITNGKLLVGQVTSFDGEYYHYMYDGIEQPLHVSNAPNWHLWTIRDAKDGDVLVDKSDGTIGIFQSIGHHPDGGSYNDPSYCFLHCRYDDGYFYADFENGNTMDSFYVIPATKEQRELLFQKMKEAGYEWDAKNKELKKVEQKPVWS